MTIYSKEMKSIIRSIKARIKENREREETSTGEQGKVKLEIGKKRGGMRKEYLSNDELQNPDGRWLAQWIEENGWKVLNENKKGNELTQAVEGRGESMIVYGIVNEEAGGKVEEFKEGGRVESVHHPLEISTDER